MHLAHDTFHDTQYIIHLQCKWDGLDFINVYFSPLCVFL